MGSGSGRGKKKRAGKSKARRAALKDSNADDDDRSDELSEELTALEAIFQDDYSLVSEKPFVEFRITLRPHSVDDGDGEDHVAVELFIRCLPGYPHRPPKLQVTSKKGLTEGQLQYLHSILAEQAASIAREGRVMVFNLTEVAQEFLSDQCKAESSLEEQISSESGAPISTSADEDCRPAIPSATPAAGNEQGSDDSMYLDLFNNLWSDNDVHLEESSVASSAVQPVSTSPSVLTFKEKQFWENTKRSERVLKGNLGAKNVAGVEVRNSSEKPDSRCPSQGDFLQVVDEECEDNEERNAWSRSGYSKSASELLQQLCTGLVWKGHACEYCESPEQNSSEASDGSPSEDDSPTSSSNKLHVPPSPDDTATQSIKKDLVLGYLLRLACSHRGPLPEALPILAGELQRIGILPQWAKDLLAKQPQLFDAMFRQMFVQLSTSAKLSSNLGRSTQAAADFFWSASPKLLGNENDSSTSSSRYSSDFEELFLLGKGGFGHVVLCKNKLDGRRYAMKKIRLKDENPVSNEKILREVATLARLQHHHVVRYYQAWIETGVGQPQLAINGGFEDSEVSERYMMRERASLGSSMQSYSAANEETKSAQATFLYIQMEYCPRTLREVFESYSGSFNKDEIWRMFRQLVEGLAHIHGQGILHRDLTPNNIFFDAHGDIKIGDFGLAKFSNLEQTDWDHKPSESVDAQGAHFEGTGEVGTYFYTAPEMDQGLPHIDVKVDIYSLGVVFFEFWYPFGTAMERYIILNDLKQKGLLPVTWSSEFVQQATLIRWLMAPNPTERPSAAQVLRSELLPPRMENESLNDILRTIQKAEDTSVYDQVVAAIFDSERIAAKAAHVDADLANLKRLEKDKALVKLVGGRDPLLESVKEVFICHGAQRVESSCFNVVDDLHHLNRQAAILLDSSGNMLDVRHEPRLLLARWVAVNQRLSLKSYELSRVYRRSVGDNAPREYFQGDFDIIGGAQTLAEAEAVKVAVEVVSKFPVWDVSEVRINHQQIRRAIWNWTGVQNHLRQKVVQILAILGSAPPQSSARKALWPIVRGQLLQGLHLEEAVVDRLQTVERRLSGSANEVLPRLRGALPPSENTSVAIDEVSTLLRYLRIWDLETFVLFDPMMAASEDFLSGVFFQVHVQNTSNNNRSMLSSACIAVGGCYNHLVAKYWNDYMASPSPSAVGLSIAVQRLMDAMAVDRTPCDAAAEVLVCSKGGGGLLLERMEIVNDLWSANIKAEYLCSEAPSFTEQYEYAHDNGMKWLVIITEAALSLAGTVKVRHLDLKVDEDVKREELVKYFNDFSSTQFNLKKKSSTLRTSSN
ncbi:unnamed protein product [Calypogeia fissa]